MEKQTINIMIPQEQEEAFRKFAEKTRKNVPDLAVSIGKPYDKVFRHYLHITGQPGGMVKEWHTVCDVEITMPEDSGWRLLATFEDGDMYVTDYSKEIVFKNPAHGKDYGRCDVCNHPCKKSHLVYNEATGEELQVGSECAKKFGLRQMDWLARFVRDLYKEYRIIFKTFDIEDEPVWTGGDSHKEVFRAIETPELICAAKAYFDEHPAWIKGYWEGRSYIKSQSNIDIQRIIATGQYNLDKAYAAKVCGHIKATAKADTEFSAEMLSLADAFYASPADAAKGFFMVKAYEDHLKEQADDYIKFEAGMQVKVSGEIIKTEWEEGFYGTTFIYTIKTSNGYIVSRRGAIPATLDDNNKQHTQFYALVEGYRNGTIIAGRATKHPKKGIEIIEL